MSFFIETRKTIVATLACCLPGLAFAGINLSRLAECDDVSAVYESLRSAAARTCRDASGGLERELLRRSNLDSRYLCTVNAPDRLLQGFSCVKMTVKKGASLSCFKAASAEDVRTYKSLYSEDFARPARQYLVSAAKCKASNGDSASATNPALPTVLSLISRFEFGYIVGLGSGRPPSSSVVHGYATLDPTLSSGGEAIEFVHFNVDAGIYDPKIVRRTVRDWIVDVDDSDANDDEFNREARRRNLPFRIDNVSFDLKRSAGKPAETDSAKQLKIERLQEAIAESFREEGFEQMSESKLRQTTGKSIDQMLEEVSKNMAFGSRQSIPVKLNRKFFFFINEDRPACARNNEGAIAAYIMAILPTPLVESDYGSVGVMVAGMGRCSRISSTTQTYMQGLIDEVKLRLLSALERN